MMTNTKSYVENGFSSAESEMLAPEQSHGKSHAHYHAYLLQKESRTIGYQPNTPAKAATRSVAAVSEVCQRPGSMKWICSMPPFLSPQMLLMRPLRHENS
jgi:hypothetical protein